MGARGRPTRGWGAAVAAAAIGFSLLPALQARSQAPLRKIGELELRLAGVSATVDPANPVVPKNVASGVRIVVRAGGLDLSAEEVRRFVGGDFEVQAELSGPGLGSTLSLPQAGEARPADPLLLMLPPQAITGDYSLSNLRLVSGDRVALDVEPRHVTVQVIDQVLVTSVKTRPLTLDEIREKGIVLDSDAYLGFEFTLGLKLESTPVNFSFPVVFDRQGVPVPAALLPPPPPPRGSLVPLPTIVPMLLEAEGPPRPDGSRPKLPLSTPAGEPIRIPSVLVIPGNVGYLKQFFSAQLFVANGAPVGSGLSVRGVTGTIRLPPGDDADPGTPDDPLALPDTVRGPQPLTLPVRGVGADGEPETGDDREALHPGEQGQAEFLIRGDREGFHTVAFDVAAVLDGLAVGPVTIAGKASGGVLVRNPYFDVTFTAPAVVRKGERFKLFATVTNIGQGLANDLSLSIDASRLSGARIEGSGSVSIDTLRPGDAATRAFDLRSERTGQVVASYLRFDTQDGSTGDLRFTLGVGERGVPLSPDTLVLPSSVESLPATVVDAAMRVLGQAWSIASAPAGTLPAGVLRTSRSVVGQKALALAEAGLRVDLGQSLPDAVRDLLFDFYGPAPVDPGLDQLLRETEAGRDFAATLGAALEDAALAAGGATGLEREASEIAAAGTDFVALGADAGSTVSLVLRDAAGRETATTAPVARVPSSVLVPLSPAGNRALGLVTSPTGSPYTLDVTTPGGSARVSITLPRGDGSFARFVLPTVESGSRITLDLARPDRLSVRQGDGPATTESGPTERLDSSGPRLLSATVIGPETLDGAGPFGQHVALLFDRIVDTASAADLTRYEIADNAVRGARRQLSGRLVFGALALPEGPYVPTELSAGGLRDARGGVGPTSTVPLLSRLEDPGAVVSGRVVNGDGTPITTGTVTYTANTELLCETPRPPDGIAARPLDGEGRYEFRYVRRDACGYAFSMLTRDPVTGAVRGASSYVRTPGEQIVLDVVLFGRGSVGGTVRDLQGQPVPSADVVALSLTDSQSGAATKTDGDGHYRVDGITVGAVSVRAAKGLYVGQASGRLDRAGGLGVVDVTLSTGSVSVSGAVRKLENGVVSPVVGAQVLYYQDAALAGVGESGVDGGFAFRDMPPGPFSIRAALNTRDRGSIAGTAAAGDVLAGRDILIAIANAAEYGTLTGSVRAAGGAPAADAIVHVGDRGVLSGPDGAYTIPGIEVRAGQAQTVMATSGDGLRTASATFVMNAVETLRRELTLSGLGSAEFQVLDVAGQPLANVDVGLLGGCSDPCGCRFKKSGADGKARFDGLPLGAVTAQALLLGTALDAARAAASILSDGALGTAVLRFAGTGSVSGLVLDPDGRPSFGADITLQANRFVNDGAYACGLAYGVSHRVRSDTSGRFRIPRVNLGPISVTASQPFFPTQVGTQGVLHQDGQELSVTLRLVNTTAGELSGTVLLPDGATPVGAGVEVTATGPLPDVTVRTSEQGRFRFARIFPEGSYTLVARDPVTGGVVQERVFLRAGQDDVHDLRLKGRGTVRVRVVDGADQPVASAYAKLAEAEFPFRTYEEALDASNEGIATFSGVFEGPFSVEARDSFGRGGRAASVVTAPGSTQEVKLRLSATGTVQGHFYKRDGTTPIPFGVVTLRVGGRAFGQIATRGTGDVGGFAFDYVPAGSFELLAQDPLSSRTASYQGAITTEGEALEVRLVAQGLGTVQGLVLQNGEPQPAAHVELVSGSFRVATLTDAAGRYVIAGVPEGRVAVTANLGNGFLQGTASGNLVGEAESLSLDVVLRGTSSLSGRVLRPDGVTPAPPSSLRMDVGVPGGGLQYATTGADGRFRFDGVPIGRASVSADDLTSPDYGLGAVDVVESQEAFLEIRLNGLAAATVNVRDAHGQPVSGARVLLRSRSVAYGQEPSILGATDEAGVAVFPEILAGRLSATATHPTTGLSGSAQGPVVADGGTAVLEVALEAAGRVEGRVVNHDGTPRPGARVLAWLPNGLRVMDADAAGAFAFEAVRLGDFTIDAQTTDGDRGRVTGRVFADTTTSVEARLTGVGAVQVAVRDNQGAGVGGVRVTLTNRGLQGETALDGSVAFPTVLAGELNVGAFDPVRLSGASASASLAPGGVAEVALTLLPAGRLQGRVLQPDRVTPAVGVTVSAASRVGVTNTDGRFELTNLPVTGALRVLASAEGRVRAFADVVPTPEAPDIEAPDLVLVGLGAVTGAVTGPDGSPVASLKVRLQHPSNLWGGSFEAATDASGLYALAGIPVGSVTLSAADAAGNRADAAAQLTDHGQTVRIDLELLASAVTLPLDLDDANGFRFLANADGTVPGQEVIHGAGTVRGPRLTVHRGAEAIEFTGSGATAASALDRREVVVRQDVPGLRLERRLYVPADGYFGRYLDVVTNTGTEAITLDVAEGLSLTAAASGPTGVVHTSSGDAEVDASDRHLVLDGGAEGDWYSGSPWPPLAIVAGTAGAVAPLFQAQDLDVGYRWNGLSLAPGQRVAVLHFLSFQGDRGRAVASAQRLEQLPPEALAGLTPEDAAAIVNFTVPADLRGALEPLALNNGLVFGRVLAGDGVTTVQQAYSSVQLKSRSPHYGRPMTALVAPDGSFTLRPFDSYDGRHLLPRTDFDLGTSYAYAESLARSAAASGVFPTAGVVDLTSLPGRRLRFSSSDGAPATRAVDRNPGSSFGWRAGDVATPSAGTPFFEIGFASEATVEGVRLYGATFLRARIEVRDALGQVLWSDERDFSGNLEIPVPGVAGRAVRLVNVVDGNPYGGSLADLEVFGESGGAQSGRAEQDLVFTGTGVLSAYLRRADGTPYPGAQLTLSDASSRRLVADTRVAPPEYRFLVVPPGDYTARGYLPGDVLPGELRSHPPALTEAVAVAADQATLHDFVFPETGRLQGQLLKADGSAAAAGITLVGPTGQRSNGATGFYSFSDLLPGSYTVSAQRARLKLTQATVVDAAGPALADFTFPPFGRLAVTATAGGLPLAGTRVGWRPAGDVNDLGDCTTDASGRCTLEDVFGSNLLVRAIHPATSLIVGTVDVAGIASEDEIVPVAIDLPRPGGVSGTIFGADGAPRAGAAVWIRLEDGTLVAQQSTAASGAFSFGAVPAGPVLVQANRSSGFSAYSPTEVPVVVVSDSTATAEIHLAGALRSPGDREVYRVALPAWAPLSGSAFGVSEVPLGPLDASVLDVYGPAGELLASGSSISIPGGAGGVHTLSVRARSDPTGAFQFNLSSSRAVRRPTGRVSGLVTLRPDAAPAPGQRVRVTSGPYIRHAETDALGAAFSADGVPAGSALVEILDLEGVALGSAPTEVTEPGEAAVEIPVSPRGNVTARVTRGGFPVVGLDVRFESDDTSAPEPDRVRVRATGADGRAAVALPAGSVTAGAIDPLTAGTFEQSGTVAAGASLTLEIALPDIPATVRGRVRFVGGSEPAAGALVGLSGVGSTATDANGDYRFDAVPTGPRTLSASFGATSTALPLTVVAGADHVVDLTLPGAVLRGVVSEPAGTVAGATVEACGPNNALAARCVATSTAPDGSYLFAGLPNWRNCNGTVGCYPVSVQVTARVSDGSGLSATTSFSYNYTAPAIHAVDLALPATGSVAGVVRDSAGQPSPGADVELSGRHVAADANGAYRFGRVRPATLRVYAERAGDRIPGLSDYGDVLAGAELTLDVALAATGSIRVTLLDESGQPLSRPINVLSLVTPTPTAYWSRDVWTAADGTLSLPAPVGPYRVVFYGDEDTALCRSDGPSAAEGELAEGGEAVVDLQRGSHGIEGILGGALGSYGREGTCAGEQVASDRLATAPWWSPGNDPVVAPEAAGRAYRTLREIGFGVEVRKQEYVPASGAFARTLTLLTNRTAGPIDLELPSSLGLPPPIEECAGPGGPAWTLVETSSGDLAFDTQDAFAIVHPNGPASAYGVVFGGVLTPTSASFWEGRLPFDADGCAPGEPGQLSLTHLVTLPPGGTRALLTFTVSRAVDDATLADQVRALADLSDPDALTGLTFDDRAAIVNFVLPGQGRLQGRVEDGDGNPAPGVRVVLMAGGAVVEETGVDAASGFVFPSVPAGDYVLVAIGPDNWPGRTETSVLGGQVTEAVVRLLPDNGVGLVLLQAVVDPPTVPVEGVGVTLSVDGYSPGWTATARFDAQGLAVLANVPSGRVRVEASDPFAGVFVEGDHAAPAATELTLALDARGRVSGVVLDPLGTPVAGALVAVMGGFGDRFAEGQTDAEGRFVLSLADPGAYRLEAFDPASGRPGSLPVSVASGQTTEVVLTLAEDAQLGSLRVSGVGAVGGLPTPGLPVSLEASGSLWTATAVLDALGQATVGLVPPGRVGVRVDGGPPDVGFAVATVAAQQLADVVIPIGAQQPFPIDLTGADLLPYFARSGSVVEATGVGEDWQCSPFCTGLAEYSIDGEGFGFTSWPFADLGQLGREVRIGPEQEHGLRLARRVFVPESGRFVRILEVIENTGASPVSVGYYTDQAHNSAAGAWGVVTTSSGDGVFDLSDSFAVMENVDLASPAMAWVHANPAAAGASHLGTGSASADTWTWFFDEGQITLQPGQQAVLLRFSVQRPHGETEAVRQQAEALADLSDPEALLGLSPDERAAVVNFVVSP